MNEEQKIKTFADQINNVKLGDNFKRHLVLKYSYGTDQLKFIKQQLILDKNADGHLRELFTNVEEGSILFIGSQRGETYLFGTITPNEKEFLFEGLYKKNYGIKADIFIINKENEGRNISHFIHLAFEESKLWLRCIDKRNLNPAIHKFDANT